MKHDQNIDQALLMMSVGSLTGWERISVSAHVITCVACQNRLNELQSTSNAIRSVYSSSNISRAKPFSIRLLKMQFAAVTIGFTVIVSAIIGGIAIARVHGSHAPISTMHCLPGIPSDRCQ